MNWFTSLLAKKFRRVVQQNKCVENGVKLSRPISDGIDWSKVTPSDEFALKEKVPRHRPLGVSNFRSDGPVTRSAPRQHRSESASSPVACDTTPMVVHNWYQPSEPEITRDMTPEITSGNGGDFGGGGASGEY